MTKHSYQRRIQFADTDAAGVAHFSRLLCFVEEAEHDFFRSRNLPSFGAGFGWPRVKLEVEFLAPGRFDDLLLVELEFCEAGKSTLTYQFAISSSGEPEAGRLLYRGRVTTCFVKMDQGGRFAASPLPEQLVALLGDEASGD